MARSPWFWLWSWCVLPGLLLGDQVALKNGDRVSGKVAKKEGGKLTLKSDLLGTLLIPWDAVQSLTTEEPLTVVLPDGRVVAGAVRTVAGEVEIETPAALERAPLAELPAMRNAAEQRAYERLQHPGWLHLWSGYADLGLALARGNARTNTFTSGFRAERAARLDKLVLHFKQIYSTATVDGVSSATARAIRGGWTYNRDDHRRFFLNAFNDYEYDRFQNLDLRFVLGGGAGVSILRRESNRLDVVAGADYNRENFDTPLTRNSAEAFWGDDYHYKVNNRFSLRQGFRLFHNLTDTGVYRVNFDLGVNTGLWKWLSWQVTGSNRFLSNPVMGKLRNDVLLTTGVRVSFAR